MSDRLSHTDVLFTQRLLRMQGLYDGAPDGVWGPRTQAAALEFERRSLILRAELGEFDPRSERHILGLTLIAQAEARRFMARVSGHGVDVRIISGTRSYAEQNLLFRQGRYGNPGPVVTHASGGRSRHNFGIAWDIGVFTAEAGYSRHPRDYAEVARLGLSDALQWGGDWPRFPDPPHYELDLRIDLAALRERFERGEPAV
ncbi:M15 family metallopeptidase [Lysobacter korlensis]|uniref:M15 family metallopeptidase n=1 Tax=Lysobacter korlensis TaxID=553636 RepID=A0ABV6RLI8_9GAMM